MKRVFVSVSALILLATAGAPAYAQAPLAPDSTLLRRADSLTVGDYCGLARRIMSDTAVVRAVGPDSSAARASAAAICNPLLSAFSLRALTGDGPAPLRAVARMKTNGYAEAQRSVLNAMSEFRASVRKPEARDVVSQSLGTDSVAFKRVAETAQGLVSREARDRAITRLAHYERKLGPTSARLNGPEVLLNYAAQRWVPLFRPTPLGGPSPLEIVASYAPGWVTITDSKLSAVSTSEFGIRWYLFGETFGRSGMAGLLHPSYWSAGVVTASDRNGALVWPWQGHDRTGPYVSWGSLKVAYVHRDKGSWLVSKQFQAVPFLF